MTTDSHARRKLRKLLTRKGYELTGTNLLGVECWQLATCGDIYIAPTDHRPLVESLIRRVESECRRKDPEVTNETARKQAAWEQVEADRVERERLDFEATKNLRLGGLAASLTELQVDQVARRAESNAAHRRQIERLMRSKPLAG